MAKFDIIVACTECDNNADDGRILCPNCYEKLEDKIADLENEVEELGEAINNDTDIITELENELEMQNGKLEDALKDCDEFEKDRDILIQLVADLKAANEGGAE